MKDVVAILKDAGAINEGHFVGTSGKHLPIYLNKDALTPHTLQASIIGKLFAEKFKNKKIEIVVAPAVGGIPYSQWTAYHLTRLTKKDVLSVFTEKTPDEDQIFKRGYDKLVKNKRALLVEDIVTTGGSIKKVIRTVKAAKGKIIAVCVMINKDPKAINTKSVGAPFSSLGVLKVSSYDEKNCPLCKTGVPVNTNLGHGKKFLESHKDKKKHAN